MNRIRKTTLTFLALATLSLGLAGCMNPVPRTQIQGTIAGQTFSLSNPKDTTITNLQVTVSTNGTATLSIGYLSSANNSNTISASYGGQAEAVTAAGEQVNRAWTNAAGLLGTAVGAAVK